jgi:hypothetical protein
MGQIKKIGDVKELVKPISEFLDVYVYNPNEVTATEHQLIYNHENSDVTDPLTPPLESCMKTAFRYTTDDEIINNVDEIVNYLKNNYNVKAIWITLFPPNTHIQFHFDASIFLTKDDGSIFTDKNRNVLTFNTNERFFTYENISLENKFNQSSIYNTKLSEITNIDEFNEYFVNEPNCEISNLEEGSIYSFGETIHSFYNGSTNKVRAAIVFDIF